MLKCVLETEVGTEGSECLLDGEMVRGVSRGAQGLTACPKSQISLALPIAQDLSATYAHGLSLHGHPEPGCQLSPALRCELRQPPPLVGSPLRSRPDPRGGG